MEDLVVDKWWKRWCSKVCELWISWFLYIEKQKTCFLYFSKVRKSEQYCIFLYSSLLLLVHITAIIGTYFMLVGFS